MTHIGLKTRQRNASIALLLAAAENVLARLGSESVTMRDFARQAGCCEATFYLYFRDKQDLIEAVITRHCIALSTEVRTAMLSTSDPAMRLMAAVQCATAYFTEHRVLARLLVTRAFAANGCLRDAVPPAARRTWDDVARLQISAIRAVQAQRRLRDDVPPEVLHRSAQVLIPLVLAEFRKSMNIEQGRQLAWEVVKGALGLVTDGNVKPSGAS